MVLEVTKQKLLKLPFLLGCVGVLISLWLFLFTAQPKEFFNG
jgi:hypothetical protein